MSAHHHFIFAGMLQGIHFFGRIFAIGVAFVLGWARRNECFFAVLGNDGGRIQYHAEGQRHSSRVAGNKHRDHGNAKYGRAGAGPRLRSSPVAECDIAPTFFDGTYSPLHRTAAPHITNTTNIRPLMGHSVPKWRYLYNTTLVVLDLLMTIVATYIVFPSDLFSYTHVQSIGPGEYGVLASCCWSAYRGSSVCIPHAPMNGTPWVRGCALYAKLLNAAFIDFIMLCTLGYLFHLNLPGR